MLFWSRARKSQEEQPGPVPQLPFANAERLRRLREAIEGEQPIDGIHNPDVERLYEAGGACPRFLGCTSEGTGESSYRDNPDFFAGDAKEIGVWLASSYEEGWAANWVLDLQTGTTPRWRTFVQMPAGSRTPFVLDSLALIGAANEVLVERKQSDAVIELVDAVTEVVNRSFRRRPEELERTKELIGAKRPADASV
jgi:hypothetical protein